MTGTIERIRAYVAPITRCIQLMLGRCVLKALVDKNPSQVADLNMYVDEVREEVERLQDYGYTSNPLPGAQGVVGFVGGDRAHGIVLKMDDRRYRPRNLKPGAMMLYTHANRKDEADTEHHIYFDPETRLVRIRAQYVLIDADENITLKAGKNIKLEAGQDIDIHAGRNLLQDADTDAYLMQPLPATVTDTGECCYTCSSCGKKSPCSTCSGCGGSCVKDDEEEVNDAKDV